MDLFPIKRRTRSVCSLCSPSSTLRYSSPCPQSSPNYPLLKTCLHRLRIPPKQLHQKCPVYHHPLLQIWFHVSVSTVGHRTNYPRHGNHRMRRTWKGSRWERSPSAPAAKCLRWLQTKGQKKYLRGDPYDFFLSQARGDSLLLFSKCFFPLLLEKRSKNEEFK